MWGDDQMWGDDVGVRPGVGADMGGGVCGCGVLLFEGVQVWDAAV